MPVGAERMDAHVRLPQVGSALHGPKRTVYRLAKEMPEGPENPA